MMMRLVNDGWKACQKTSERSCPCWADAQVPYDGIPIPSKWKPKASARLSNVHDGPIRGDLLFFAKDSGLPPRAMEDGPIRGDADESRHSTRTFCVTIRTCIPISTIHNWLGIADHRTRGGRSSANVNKPSFAGLDDRPKNGV
ncbi:hypothetical protein RB8119 [Rhodopirellula baltica SH 1]|uniref:Uncharacterized protein n=1 Tax=Rhodopirellula baltica (strain DSM 10527 / NCIMB 13988 / SH1) TaxID=243090 RepID=Q7UG51_RHOBA|nr:hypothetical protein RB8119 [Rhodopirellula baltica SH 1]